MSGQLPCLKIRAWPISLAVWKHKNEDRDGYWFSGSLQKTYKDSNGEYQNTDRLNGDDFLKAASLLEEAHRRLVIQEQEVKRKNGGGEEPAGDDGDDNVPF